MTKPTSTDRLESARKILNAPPSTIAELEAARAVVTHVLAETDAEVEEMVSRRKTIASANAPAGEIDKALERHDDAVRALVRRNEIAAAVAAKLDERIAADREVARAAKCQANYDAALTLHVAATNRVREFLDKFGPECRRALREYAESELKTAAANSDLPPGALPIPSIEVERKGKLQPPKVTTRHFKAFVHAMRRVAEQGYVEAAPEKDGRWRVFIPGGSTSGGYYLTCALVDFVEVVTETDATPWLENLARALSVSAFYATEPPGWRPLEHASTSGSSIAHALTQLESRPPYHYPPSIETRVMRLAAWRELNGEIAEAEPAAALAAE
jgi:hypothetical protein